MRLSIVSGPPRPRWWTLSLTDGPLAPHEIQRLPSPRRTAARVRCQAPCSARGGLTRSERVWPLERYASRAVPHPARCERSRGPAADSHPLLAAQNPLVIFQHLERVTTLTPAIETTRRQVVPDRPSSTGAWSRSCRQRSNDEAGCFGSQASARKQRTAVSAEHRRGRPIY